MPICQIFRTRCRHCGWRGNVTRGDVRMGPIQQPDGTVFHLELVCPSCSRQVENPFPEDAPPNLGFKRRITLSDWIMAAGVMTNIVGREWMTMTNIDGKNGFTVAALVATLALMVAVKFWRR